MICSGEVDVCLCERCLSSLPAASPDSRSRPLQHKPCSEPVVVVGNGLPVPARLASGLLASDRLDAELRSLGLPGLDDLDESPHDW